MWVHQEKAQRNVVLFYLPEDKQLGIEMSIDEEMANLKSER